MAASPLLEIIDVNQDWTTVGHDNRNVILQGRFYGNNSRQPMLTQIFIPTYEQTQDSDSVKIRWDSMQYPEWWAELSFNVSTPNSAIFKGRNIPFNATLTRLDQENNTKVFRFDSKTNLEFWAQITIIED